MPRAHLHGYLAKVDFRYNRRSALKIEDAERHDMLLAMIGGRRLTCRTTAGRCSLMADSKPKAKGIPPPAEKTPVEKTQRERFIEAAREAGVDDESFEKGLRKVAPPKHKK